MKAVFSKIGLAAAVLAAATFGFGCPGTEDEEVKEKTKVGFVYLSSPGDVGWTYAHHLGVEQAKAELDDVEVIVKEGVPEGDGTIPKIEELVAAGCKIIFTTSFGYMDPTAAMAEKYPDVKFEHCSGFKSSTNMANYFGRIYQGRYLSGIAAGRMTSTKSIGYVAAFPIPEVISGINAFTLGVRSVKPDAVVHVKFTSTWYDPVVEGNTAQELIDMGVDVIAQHQDTTAMVEKAQAAGIYAVGYNSDMVPFAPDTVLTGPIWNWGVYYKARIKAVQDGTWATGVYFGSIADGLVDVGPFGNRVPQSVKDEIATKRQQLIDGTWDVFYGPLKKQDGTAWIAENQQLSDGDILSMMEFVEGVDGVIPAAK